MKTTATITHMPQMLISSFNSIQLIRSQIVSFGLKILWFFSLSPSFFLWRDPKNPHSFADSPHGLFSHSNTFSPFSVVHLERFFGRQERLTGYFCDNPSHCMCPLFRKWYVMDHQNINTDYMEWDRMGYGGDGVGWGGMRRY